MTSWRLASVYAERTEHALGGVDRRRQTPGAFAAATAQYMQETNAGGVSGHQRIGKPMSAQDCEACAARVALTSNADSEGAPAKGSMLFESHDGGRVACPDCGRLYLQTPELATAPANTTELVRLLRCPRCRSTRVSRSTWEVSDDDDVRLMCGACHHQETVDADDCTGWKVFLDLPTGQRQLPEFVPLADELPAAPVKALAPVVDAAKPAPAVVVTVPVLPPQGCARCVEATAATAWTAIAGPATRTFVRELHFSVHATRCSCGQPFVVVFTERVDFRDGSDTQVELAVALWPAELEALGARFSPLALTKLVSGRAFLVKGTGDPPRWVASGFSIGPHD